VEDRKRYSATTGQITLTWVLAHVTHIPVSMNAGIKLAQAIGEVADKAGAAQGQGDRYPEDYTKPLSADGPLLEF
jgi:hypothetical protein